MSGRDGVSEEGGQQGNVNRESVVLYFYAAILNSTPLHSTPAEKMVQFRLSIRQSVRLIRPQL